MQKTPGSCLPRLAALAVVVGMVIVAVAPFLIQTCIERFVASRIGVFRDRSQSVSGVMRSSFA